MRKILAALALLGLAACGSEGPNGPDQSAGGYFIGQLTPSGAANPDDITALIDETGFGFVYNEAGATYYAVQTRPDGRVLAGDFRAYPPGAAAVDGTLSGTIAERGALTGFTTSSRGNEAFTIAYQAAPYEQPSSYLLVTGDFQYIESSNAATVSLSIGGSGAITGTDSTGCSLAGQLGIPDSRFNAYRVDVVRQCSGLADQTLSGLASYAPQDGATPPMLLLGLSDGAEFATVALAQKL